MIKTTTSCLIAIFMSLASLTAVCQPTLQTSNLPNVGDIWAYKTITDTTIQPGLTGTGITWNLSSYFVNPTVFNAQYLAVGSTGDDALFPTANLKVSSSFSGFEYYKRTASGMEFLGYKSPSNDLLITNLQSYLTVPLQYGQSVTNIPVTGVSFSGFNVTGTISAVADGTGTLQLATGTTNNALRVFYDINLVVGGDIGLNTDVRLRRYCWYRTGLRAPVFIIESLLISGNLGNSYQKSVLVNTTTPTAIDELKSAFSFSISPNPVREKSLVKLNVDKISEVNYSIMDITGRIWKQESVMPDATKSFTIDAANLPKGIYILCLQSADVKKQQRFIVE